jgi:hypothetical protein
MDAKSTLATVISVLHEFLRESQDLLEVGINERTLTHKLAELLQLRFKRWHVDCEYNRLGDAQKTLPPAESTDTSDTQGRTIYPDIIIHKRRTPENLLVIEVKKVEDGREAGDIISFRP